jgi:hypothetical protein
MHLKLAAHALRELGLLLPVVLGIPREKEAGRGLTTTLRTLWRALPATPDVGHLHASIYDTSALSYDETRIPADLYQQTRAAFSDLDEEEAFASILGLVIKALDPLGDPAVHDKIGPEVRHWRDLHNWFVGRAHARDLNALESERQTFLKQFDAYRMTLRAMFERAIDILPDIARLQTLSPHDPGVLDHAVALLKRAEMRRRFFLELGNEEWLEPLDRMGVFADPYPPQPDGAFHPPWPQSQYLIRVASQKASVVTAIITRLAPALTNATVQADFVEAALAMPAVNAAALVDPFSRWLSGRVSMRVPLFLGKLSVKLAKEGEPRAALRLLRAMLRFDAPPSDEDYLRTVAPRVGKHAYRIVLREAMTALVDPLGEELLHALCRCLRGVIAAEQGHRPDDFSYVWMPIFPEADTATQDVRHTLVAAVLRVATTVASRGAAECGRVVDRLAREHGSLFRRMELLVLARASNSPDLMRSRLLDQGQFQSERLRREYAELQAATWGHLSQPERDHLIDWIAHGPNQEWLNRRELERTGQPAAPELLERHRASWQLARLEPIADRLTGEGQALFERLRSRQVEPLELPTSGVTTFVGPTSPASPEELRTKTPSEIVEFLKTWVPSYEIMAPSPEGLGRALTPLVVASPRSWSELAGEFRGMNPTYVRSYLEGLKQVAGSADAIEWDGILELCTWVVDQPPGSGIDDPHRDEDPDWNWTRKTIASLLQHGLQRGLGLPFNHRSAVWSLIQELLGDPDPDSTTRELSRDPENVSLNSVRGVTMHAAVEYALWCARNLSAPGVPRPDSWFGHIPEVREVLEAKLDPSREACAAIPSVLAHYLPNLLYLDRGWFESRLPDMFRGQGAAWEVYLLYVQPHPAVLPLLAPIYLEAAETLATTGLARPKEVANQLAEHLLAIYAHLGSKMPQIDAILTAFFEHATVEQRAHLIGFAGWHVEESKDIGADALQRIMDLVDRRIGAVTSSGEDTEAHELWEWASLCRGAAFPDPWVLAVAKRVVPLVPGSYSAMWVGERMGEVARTDVAGAVEVLQAISVKDLGPMGIHDWLNPAHEILAHAMAAGGSTREAAVAAINNFTERGFSQFEKHLPR